MCGSDTLFLIENYRLVYLINKEIDKNKSTSSTIFKKDQQQTFVYY